LTRLTALLMVVLSPAMAEAQYAPRAQLMRPADMNSLPLRARGQRISSGADRIATRDVTMVFADSARKRGDSVEVISVPALGHHDVMPPRTEAGKAAIEAVVRLLRPGTP